MDYAKREDDVETMPRRAPLGDGTVVGTWVNTNPASRGIVRLTVSATPEGGLTIRPWTADAPPADDWGELPVDTLFGDRLDATTVAGFTASRTVNGLQTELHANVSLGLLIVAAFHRATDRSGRANFYAREFYRRADGS